eukprot:4007562-Pleurochrysis_carterae.AAC.1
MKGRDTIRKVAPESLRRTILTAMGRNITLIMQVGQAFRQSQMSTRRPPCWQCAGSCSLARQAHFLSTTHARHKLRQTCTQGAHLAKGDRRLRREPAQPAQRQDKVWPSARPSEGKGRCANSMQSHHSVNSMHSMYCATSHSLIHS